MVVIICHACHGAEKVPGGHFTDEMVGGWGDKFLCSDCRAKERENVEAGAASTKH